jgi:hypothetical protein
MCFVSGDGCRERDYSVLKALLACFVAALRRQLCRYARGSSNLKVSGRHCALFFNPLRIRRSHEI